MLSVIIPSYNEENIEANLEYIIDILVKSGILYEIIVVDDGSDYIEHSRYENILKRVENMKIIYLSRNFGKENALRAGIDNASGDCIVCIDADLQHPPEMIPIMYRIYKECGYDVIEGVKSYRGKRNAVYTALSGMFYNLMKIVSGRDIKRNSDFRLIGEKPLSVIKNLSETDSFFREVTDWIGFSRARIYFDINERSGGKSKWTMKKLFSLAVSAITRYSSAPLYIPLFAGCMFMLFSAVFLIYNFISGILTYMPVLFFIAAVLLLCMGFTAIYIDKIYKEVRHRQCYVISEVENSRGKE